MTFGVKNIAKDTKTDCQFKGNKSKIQKLIRKVHINPSGSVTEVQFVKETSQGTKNLRTKRKNLFRRK